MATKVLDFPLTSGQDEGTDRLLLDLPRLRAAQNCRLARDGRLEVRPGFTQLSTDTYSSGGSTLVAHDLANYAGRLVALGSQVTSITTRPTDLFEYIESTNTWRATAGDNQSATAGPRLPRLTDIRAIGQVPDLPSSVFTGALAAGGGYVCAVYEKLGTNESVVNIIDPTTDQSIILETVALRRPVAVFVGSTFWILGIDSDEDVVGVSFAPATDETLSSVATLISNATAVVDFAACVFGSLFAVAYCTASSAVVATYNSAGVQQATATAVAANTLSVALTSNTGGTLLSLGYQDASALYFLRTYNAALALQNGPTALFGGAGGSGRRLGLCFDTLEVVAIGVDELNSRALLQRITQSSHSLGTTRNYRDARPEGAPVTVGSGSVFAGFVDLSATNFDLGTYHVIAEETLIPQCFVAPQLCTTTTTGGNTIQAMAASGTKLYFMVISVGIDGGNFSGQKLRGVVYEAETSGLGRRQMVQVGGELLIAGGLPLSYDGRVLAETGFAERPVVFFDSENTTGALALLGVYNAVAVWEVFDSRGRLLRSQASSPRQHTLTGANDAIVWKVTTPHSLRRHPAYVDQGQTVRVSIYRTESGQGVFFLDVQTTVNASGDIGDFVTLTSTGSDANLIDNLVLYEQSQTPISHVSPQPYRYAAAAREREVVAGLPEQEAYAFSKLLFPAEPLEFAPPGQLGFTGRVSEPITAVGAFSDVALAWTESSLWAVTGRGPGRNGVGEFDAAQPIPTPGGTYDWRSVLVYPGGAFFQMRPDRLMAVSRGFEVTWAGSPVQDTLASYPNIAGAVFCRDLDQVAFACNNNAGTDGVLLIFDLASGAWFVDTIGAAISAISEYDGRLVYVSGGSVFLQNATIGGGIGALPTITLDTGSFRLFPAGGYGTLCKLVVLGTYVGDSTLEAFVSYDDGKTWTSCGQQAVTAANMFNPQTGAALASGDPVTVIFTPNRREVDRFAIRLVASNATNTGGLRLHMLSLEVEAQDFATRQAARNQR